MIPKLKKRPRGSPEAEEKLIVCLNKKCDFYNKIHYQYIVKASNYGKDRTKKRWRCNWCGKTLSDNCEEPTYRKRKLEEFAKFEVFNEQGLSVREIAKELNVSKNTVWRWRKKLKTKT